MWTWISLWRTASAKRREAERSYRDIYENISEGIYRSSPGGEQISANPALVRLNGYDTESEMLAAVQNLDTEWYVEPGRRKEFQTILTAEGRVSDFVSEVYRHRTRERIWITENARLVRDERTGAPLYYEGTVREITDTIQRLELQKRYEKLASMVLGCLFQFRLKPDGATAFPYASPGIEEIFGIKPDEVRDSVSKLYRRLHPQDIERVESSMRQSAATLETWVLEFRICLPDGTQRWVFGNAAAEREADGSVLWHGFFSDITERKENERRIEALAFRDPLTGLANRRLMQERLETAVAESGEHGEYGVVLFIDVDQFKTLNDTRGHRIGDLVLIEVGRRLRACVRDGDTVARAGGDEFVIILPRLGRDVEAARAFARLLVGTITAAGGEPWSMEAELCRPTLSIGVTLFHGSNLSADEILRQADDAMYGAKNAGRDNVKFFEGRAQRVMPASA